MELTVYVAAYRHRAFLGTFRRKTLQPEYVNVPLAERWTLPEALREPTED